MARIALTERFIASKKRIPPSGRADFPDSLVPGLALRCTAQGHRSFVLIARYPLHPQNPTRRALGDYGALTLDDAREKARNWIALIKRGVDPKIAAARERAEEQRKQVNSFAHVAAEYLDRHAVKLAHAAEARRIIEAEFVKRWGIRPVTDIQPDEIAAAIRIIAKRAEAQAHNSLGHIRRLYSWAQGTHQFGITASPVAGLRPADLIGKRVVRNRVLKDSELRAVWEAASAIGYPSGDIVRLLILSAQRLNEIASLTWREIDLDERLIVISAARMKGDRVHEVPICDDALALLQSLPRLAGDYVFSATAGAKPFSGFSKAKRRIDELSGVKQWVLHDLRRTARTHFSALPVQDMVRELVIAHARPGLHVVYDQHSYRDEKRECLMLWEHRLRGILHPAPADITDIAQVRQRRTVA
jgi:integrase